MSKSGYLLKNLGLLGLSNFGSKILVFLLVPLYTSVLSTADYGEFDIYYSAIQVLFPILTLNISDAVMRFALDRGANTRQIMGVGFCLVSIGDLIAVAASAVFYVTGVLGDYSAHINYACLFYISYSFYHLMAQSARGLERVLDLAVAGLINTVLILGCNIVFLVFLDLGLDGFFMAYIIGSFVPAIFLFARLGKAMFFVRESSSASSLAIEMIKFAVPMGVAALGWWMVNLSGRFIVTAFCGAEANGLYSVAYKIPGILNVVQVIFIQAWQISAVKEYDKSDSDGFFGKTFSVLSMGMILGSSVLIALCPFIAAILFQGDFYSAWQFVPFLLVAVALNVTSGLWDGIFAARKDTKRLFTATVTGALAGIVSGVILVQLAGVQGVAFSNLIASLVIWLLLGRSVGKHIETDFHIGKMMLRYAALVAQSLVMLGTLPAAVVAVCEGSIFLLLLLSFKNELALMLSVTRRALSKGE